MTEKLSGLLGYRFQKRTAEKTVTSNESASEKLEKTADQSPTRSDAVKSETSTPESVVFNGIKAKNKVTSSANHNSRDTRTNSGWLSKATIHNSVDSSSSSATDQNSQTSTSSYSPSQTTAMTSASQTSTVSDADDNRQFDINISTLQTMFPQRKRDELVEYLDSAENNVERAIDELIMGVRPCGQLLPAKRSRPVSGGTDPLTSPESSPVKRVYKRVRIMSSDDDDSQNIAPNNMPSSQSPMGQKLEGSSDSSAKDSVSNQSLDMNIKTHMKYLKEAFPSLPEKVLEDVLTKSNGNTDKASQTLIDLCKDGNSKSTGNTRRSFDGKHCELGSDDDVDDDDEDYMSSDDEIEADVGQQAVILKFMNESNMSDLLSVSGCSKKKAELIIDLRPFASYQDLIDKILNQPKTLTLDLIAQCKELLRIRQTVQHLMKRCEKISRNLEGVVSELTSKTSTQELGDSEREYISSQPKLLADKLQLTPYQMIGLNWLVIMHDQELHGILGDEMGLGKTIQTIAFLAYMKENNISGPHLVVAPASTLDNWLREMTLWCPTLNVQLYYGSQEDRAYIRRMIVSGEEEFDVILTTYQMTTGSVEDRNMFKKFQWHYAVFDEGHMLKNMSSQRYKTLMKISADRRLLLTGTPLQNNLIELMSLLAFVMPNLFSGKTDHLKRIFATITGHNSDESRSSYEKESVVHAQQILRPFFLRRLKSQVLKQLPPKHEHVEHVPMATRQQDIYTNMKKTFTQTMRDASGTSTASGASMIMQLRKAANHPLLHRRLYTEDKLKVMAKEILKEPAYYDSVEQYVFEDMEVMNDFELHRLCSQNKTIKKFMLDDPTIVDSGKFKLLDEMLPKLKDKGSRVLIFSQFTMMLDIVEVYMKQRSHQFLRLDGSTPVAERIHLLDKFNGDKSIFIFLLSTKAGGLGINLTAADTVILHDIDFNPYNDKQAEDRCHRLGQKREVSVYRFLSSGTIEENMWKCAQAKLRLEQDVTGQKRGDEEMNQNDVASLIKEALAIENTAS